MNGARERLGAGLAGIATLLAFWEIAGRNGTLGASWPPFSVVVHYFAVPQHRMLLAAAAAHTLGEAALGFVLGGSAGCAFAVVAVLAPAAAPGLDRFAAIVNGIPVIAVAALCAVTIPSALIPIVVATLAVFFMLFIAAAAGLNAAPAAQRDLLAVLGASRWTTFARLQLPAALPALVDGLRLSAPVAIVGAIIGEWFSADTGLGPLLVNAMQNYQIDLLWAAALTGAVMSATAYFAFGLLHAAAAGRYTPR